MRGYPARFALPLLHKQRVLPQLVQALLLIKFFAPHFHILCCASPTPLPAVELHIALSYHTLPAQRVSQKSLSFACFPIFIVNIFVVDTVIPLFLYTYSNVCGSRECIWNTSRHNKRWTNNHCHCCKANLISSPPFSQLECDFRFLLLLSSMLVLYML